MRAFFAGLLLLALSACMTAGPGGGVAPGYIVFFTERSAALEPAALAVIAQAAAASRAAPDAPVVVLGYTDSAGSPAADVSLSQQRARVVADALTADGVAPGRIARQGRGQTHDDPGVESRRVEIRVGG